MYPSELVLSKENASNNERSFLGLSVNIENNQFSIQLSDKGDNFSFSLVKMSEKQNLTENVLFWIGDLKNRKENQF